MFSQFVQHKFSRFDRLPCSTRSHLPSRALHAAVRSRRASVIVAMSRKGGWYDEADDYYDEYYYDD